MISKMGEGSSSPILSGRFALGPSKRPGWMKQDPVGLCADRRIRADGWGKPVEQVCPDFVGLAAL
jgi:hypothetical protein